LIFIEWCDPETEGGLPSLAVVGCGTTVNDPVLRCTDEVQVLDISIAR
jgi:hypothetical protein